jgi:hypothetical protein
MVKRVFCTAVQRKSPNLDSITQSQWSASRGSPASVKSGRCVVVKSL